jgi:hypothetical protein
MLAPGRASQARISPPRSLLPVLLLLLLLLLLVLAAAAAVGALPLKTFQKSKFYFEIFEFLKYISNI